MQELRFIVKGSSLRKDPSSNFGRIIAGTSNWYKAVFDFDETWAGFACVADFSVNDTHNYVPLANGGCAVPEEVLNYRQYHVQIIGQRGKTRRLTSSVKVNQIGGE